MANMGYTFTGLENLWKQVGGNAGSAPMAAAIAMAESGGNPNATNRNTNGTTDKGLWQINTVHGGLSTYDPTANARAAVQISGNGTTWRPWCTAWSNGRCGGSYLGIGAPFLKFLPGGANTGSTAPSPTTDTTQAAFGLPSLPNPFSPSTWANAFLRPIGSWLWYGLMAAGGAALIGVGMFMLIRESATFKTVTNIVTSAATKGAVSAPPPKEASE